MSELEKDSTLKSVLLEAAKSGERLRFYGAGMIILAEGVVAYVGDGIVGIRHHDKEKADEFVVTDCITKVQVLGEYRHY
ncbi:MAG: hypothetical protein AM324_002455 [Candidatus Thorarchaeota archaeon SMTZ1-83]|nr:MAG: hypothetical protein AM324_03465 [Candidatus Thorarchaeota archaeon SMTZ1-83]